MEPTSIDPIQAVPPDVARAPVAPIPVIQQPVPEQEIFSWQSPSRLYKKRTREFYTTVGAIVLLLSIILIFAKEFLLVAVIFASAFVTYVLSSVEPETVEHQLTNKGIRTAKKMYPWQLLGRFWFEEKWKQTMVKIELPYQFPGEILMLVGQANKDEIEEILLQYLIKQKPEPTFVEKASKWLQEKIPLEADGV
jgi:hypothetical protein